jgi:hypothetical protein
MVASVSWVAGALIEARDLFAAVACCVMVLPHVALPAGA